MRRLLRRLWHGRTCDGPDCPAKPRIGRYCIACAAALNADPWRG